MTVLDEFCEISKNCFKTIANEPLPNEMADVDWAENKFQARCHGMNGCEVIAQKLSANQVTAAQFLCEDLPKKAMH